MDYTIFTPLLREMGIVDQVEFTPEQFEQYKAQYLALLEAPAVVLEPEQPALPGEN